MSRIIVKNLPEKVTKETLTKIFSEKGVITDVQLKFTKDGKFRKFAFIGFQKQESAQAAKESLNRTFINTSQIEVEICAELGDPNKPRAWSKYAPENILAKQEKSLHTNNVAKKETKNSNETEKFKIKNPKVKELLEKHQNDTLFTEFMEVAMPQLKSDLLFPSKDEKMEVTESDKEDERNFVMNQAVSDSEYLKLKTGQDVKLKTEGNEIFTRVGKNVKSIQLFTVKLSGLPVKIKKSDIKQFLSPAKPFTIRKALRIKGVAYCGFKSNKDMRAALLRNKSFLNGKRIFVTELKKNTSQNEGMEEKWKAESDRLKDLVTISESGRIFIRNLPYTATEEDLRGLFEPFGLISELIMPIDSFTRRPKGFAIVTFLIPENANKAYSDLDGTIFQGRMLHLLPALPNDANAQEEDTSGDSFKVKKLKKEKAMTGSSVNWNTFFIGENALAETMAETYNTAKENVLDDKHSGAAVRLALGESQLVNKIKDFLKENDVSLEAFENMSVCPRSKTVILVKNLPFGTKSEDLREKFSQFGELKRIVLPPAGIAALVEFVEASEAKRAFRRLAYSKFKHVPLYLEWAPKKIFSKESVSNSNIKDNAEENKTEKTEAVEAISTEEKHAPVAGATIFVKNLNFLTDDDALKQHFSSCGTVVSATVSRKKDLSHPGRTLSMGYGFVKFSCKEFAEKALKTLQFSTLHDHKIELKRSDRTLAPDTIPHRSNSKSNEKPSEKILVRNVPFQATQREINDLFKVFGEIKAIRLPQKMVGTGSHRGFCFVEYNTVQDAKRAFNALCQSTHLYGRRLVLEWAAGDDDVETLRKKTAQRFNPDVGRNTEQKKNINMDDYSSED